MKKVMRDEGICQNVVTTITYPVNLTQISWNYQICFFRPFIWNASWYL